MSPAINSIASMLQMGKRYAIAHLEAAAIGRLKNNYPQTLEDYDAAKMAGPKAHIFSFDTPNEIKALSLALEHNVQSVLPMMYFRCCEYLVRHWTDSYALGSRSSHGANRCISLARFLPKTGRWSAFPRPHWKLSFMGVKRWNGTREILCFTLSLTNVTVETGDAERLLY